MSRAMCGLAVLAIVLCGAAASPALHAQSALHKEKMGELGWVDPYSNARMGPEGQWTWFRELLDDAKWDDSNPTCLQHEQDMEEFIGPSEDKGTVMYWARDRTKRRQGQTISVSYGGQTEWFVVFQRATYSDDDMLNLLLHEGWHWAHKETAEGTAAKAAENCAWIPLEEEDDECASADGMAADCNGGGTPKPETCTETQEWVPPVTIEVFVKPESSTLEQGSPVETDKDKQPVFDLGELTVSADSKGQWVEVVVEEGYWQTVTECTES